MKSKAFFLSLFLIVSLVLPLYQIPKVDAAADWTTPDAVHSKCGETDPRLATLAMDDDIETYWRHDVICFHWIIFDMGSTKTITKIRLYQSNLASRRWGQATGLYVYIGDNPADLGDAVWEGNLDTSGWQESGAFEKNGRYVKLVSKDDGSSQRMYEFDAYAEAAAAGEDYTADLSQSLTTTWSVLTEWDATTDFSQSIATSWNVLANLNTFIDLSQALSTTWNLLIGWGAIVDFSQALSTSWTVLTQTSFNIITSLSNTFSWLVDVVHTVGGIAYIADLSQAISTAWTILTQTTFNVNLSESLTTTWTVLIQSSFNIVTSLSNTFTWTVDILKGVIMDHIVDLALTVVTSWIIDVVRTPWTEIYATKGFVLATIMLLLLIGLPIFALIWRRKE